MEVRLASPLLTVLSSLTGLSISTHASWMRGGCPATRCHMPPVMPVMAVPTHSLMKGTGRTPHGCPVLLSVESLVSSLAAVLRPPPSRWAPVVLDSLPVPRDCLPVVLRLEDELPCAIARMRGDGEHEETREDCARHVQDGGHAWVTTWMVKRCVCLSSRHTSRQRKSPQPMRAGDSVRPFKFGGDGRGGEASIVFEFRRLRLPAVPAAVPCCWPRPSCGS